MKHERTYEIDIRKLSRLSIYQLREVGSRAGVRSPTSLKRADLINAIKEVLCGDEKPYLKTKSGRPHKNIISDEDWDRLVGFDSEYEFCKTNDVLTLYANTSDVTDDMIGLTHNGYVARINKDLVVTLGNADSIRLNTFAKVTAKTIHGTQLKHGDFITCSIARDPDIVEAPIVTEVYLINGVEPKEDKVAKETSHQARLLELTKMSKILGTFNVYAPEKNKEIALDPEGTYPFTYNQLQFLRTSYPLRRGARALFVGDDDSGQDYLSNSLVRDLSKMGYRVMYISANQDPDNKLSFNGNVEYFFSTFGAEKKNVVYAFELAFARAKELSKDEHVAVVINDFTFVMSAYEELLAKSSNYNQSGVLLDQLKTLFACTSNQKDYSLSVFCFGNTPTANEIPAQINYRDIEKFLNCKIALDHKAYIAGEDDFLIHEATYVKRQPRQIED